MTSQTETGLAFLLSLSWLFLIATLILLTYVILRSRYLFVKPSMIFALFFHVQIQWPSIVYWYRIADNLTNPAPFFILAQLFPFLLVSGSLLIGRNTAKDVYARVLRLPESSPGAVLFPLLPLSLVSLVIVGWYLWTVPWDQSGLHAVLFHPEKAKMAREQSLKLLTNKYLKYAVSIFNSSIAPVLACLLGFKALDFWRRRRYVHMGVVLLGVAPILVAVSLSGARGPGVMVILTTLLSIFLLRGLPLQPVRIIMILLAVLIIPGALELLRMGGNFSTSEIVDRYAVIVERVLGYGMTVDAQWHVEYVTRYGFWGIAGVEKLAPLFGVQPLDILNIVGRYYTDPSATISANASVIFLYYACFGMLALPLCLLLSWLLDTVLLLYRKMHTIMLPVAIAACGIAAANLAHTAYTTIFITHGFMIVLALCFFLDVLIARLNPSASIA